MENEKLIFSREWLGLPKGEFKMLVMIADKGKSIGNLSDMCRYFKCTPQSATKNRLREALMFLDKRGIIKLSHKGLRYSAPLRYSISDGDRIEIKRKYITEIRQHNYSRSVSWEKVLKVYLWTLCNANTQFTNRDLEKELGASESTLSEAKSVLIELGAIAIDYVHTVKGERIYRCGQIADPSAFWYNV